MMQTLDPATLAAFGRLLERADPTDLPRRAHIYRCEGDPNRRSTRLPGILMAWLQHRHLAVDIEAPQARARPERRRMRLVHSGLRALRPTGTG